MALELRQSLKLSQQLVITPALEQAIRLLQLNHQELLSEVQTEFLTTRKDMLAKRKPRTPAEVVGVVVSFLFSNPACRQCSWRRS